MTVASNKAEGAFLRAYDEHCDAIFRFLFFRTGDRESANDLTQETFTRAWKYIVGGREVPEFKAFLYTIARNLVIDEARKKKEISLETLMSDGFEPGNDEKEKTQAAIDAKKMIDVVAKVNEDYAEVLSLRYIDGLGPKEIAAILNESPDAISVRINRGKKVLQQYLEV